MLWALSNCAREIIVWVSRKQIIAVSSVSPNVQCLIANYRCPKQPSSSQLYTLPTTFTLACPHVSISFVLHGKENLLCLLEVVKIKFLFVKSLEIEGTTYNCTLKQFSFERYHHGFSRGLKVTMTNNLFVIWPRFRGEAVTKIYKGPSKRLLTDP